MYYFLGLLLALVILFGVGVDIRKSLKRKKLNRDFQKVFTVSSLADFITIKKAVEITLADKYSTISYCQKQYSGIVEKINNVVIISQLTELETERGKRAFALSVARSSYSKACDLAEKILKENFKPIRKIVESSSSPALSRI